MALGSELRRVEAHMTENGERKSAAKEVLFKYNILCLLQAGESESPGGLQERDVKVRLFTQGSQIITISAIGSN